MPQTAKIIAPAFAVVDEEVTIRVERLPPRQPVTVASYVEHRENMFVGFGHFYSDDAGALNLSHASSLGGTYTGLQPMGIFSSAQALISKNRSPRLIVISVEEPLEYEITVWAGHRAMDQFHGYGHYRALIDWSKETLALCSMIRSYLAPGVQRIPIRAPDLIRGTLFIPQGPGPFSAVIDTFGGIGNCVEIRAALYARHGFISLALGYFNFEDLDVHSISDIRFDYFTKAVDFLLGHPKARPGSVGMVGTSLSSPIITNMAMRDPRVRIVICVNTAAFVMLDPDAEMLVSGDQDAASGAWLTRGTYRFTNGVIKLHRNKYHKVIPDVISPKPLKHTHDVKVMFLLSADDTGTPNKEIAEAVKSHFATYGKAEQVEMHVVPSEGHLLEPCYMPMASIVPVARQLTALINYGGSAQHHTESQRIGWHKLLRLLKEHLDTVKAKL